ncbi:hypothetical protein [Clostridium cuniculi]|uniref:hypothetical protein n=1 Tax=Clostridium cuniculi TaxID=2548455 RepID=UPI00105511D3|nr:hypothetical protein [Clostridium cuniculi]
MWGKFCDIYSPNAEKDRELRLLCELQGKNYDKIWHDIARKKKTEKVAEEKIEKLMELFEELYEAGVSFNRIHEVGVNIDGVEIGRLVDYFGQDKPVYLKRF